MRRRIKTLSVLLIGLGLGVVGSTYLDRGAAWWAGVVTAMTGVLLASLVVGPADAAGGAGDDEPQLRDLGTRVEQILRMAEDQARDHLDEAERTLSAARAEAHAIVAAARADAAGTDPRREPPGGQV